MVSQTLLSELKTIFLEDYGVNLSQPEIKEASDSLIQFFERLEKIDYQKKAKKNEQD